MKVMVCIVSMVSILLLVTCGGTGSAVKSEDPTPPRDQYFRLPGDYAGSHILIAYAGAQNATEQITRTKEEAFDKANQLLAEILAAPATFEAVAEVESDGPSKILGGSLGSWAKGAMLPEFDEAVAGLAEGEISTKPAETAFGYHLIRRDGMVVKHYGADGFIIAFKGPNTPATIARTKEEARKMSEDLADKVTAKNFEEMALQYNDLGKGSRFLGAFKDKDQIPPDFMKLVSSLAFGEVGGPVETPIGFAFIQRVPLVQFAGAHILISYKGANQARANITRTKPEAQALAEQLLAQLQSDPDQFATLAGEQSDGPTSAQGGDLGTWFKGLMLPQIDEAFANLEVGTIAPKPVETEFGFHLLKRNPTPETEPPAEQ